VSSAAHTLAETPDTHGAFPRLSPEQIAALERIGQRVSVQPGDTLFAAGDPSCDFYVILDGSVAIVEDDAGAQRVIGVHGPGRFLGELNLLTGQTVFLTAVVRDPGTVLRVPVERLRELVTRDPTLGDPILRAYLIRRALLIDIGTGFRIIGSRYSPGTRRLREFATRNRLPHRWLDLEQDPQAEQLLRELGIPPEDTPIVITDARTVLRNPSNADVARALGLSAPRSAGDVCDLVVVGAGPAGLAAGVYGASEGLDTVVLDAIATGGQAATSSRIENYLGFPAGISGAELAERATIQARKFGARIVVPARAIALSERAGHHVVTLEDGDDIEARAIVIASGVHYRRLPLAGLGRLEGVSVFYAATAAEAHVCHGSPVAVVGAGNSAGQAALFLAQHVPQVSLVIRDDQLGAQMSRYLADRIERTPNIEVLLHSDVRELVADAALEQIVVQDTHSATRRTIAARALFVFIGTEPHTQWLGEELELDDHGYVITGLDLETSRPGVFAAGDVRSGSIKRVASAVGEGAMAVRFVHQRLGELATAR
jgi:thioredoxin reductase (NADPH)